MTRHTFLEVVASSEACAGTPVNLNPPELGRSFAARAERAHASASIVWQLESAVTVLMSLKSIDSSKHTNTIQAYKSQSR